MGNLFKKIKILINRNRLAKLVCLILAIVVWCAIKYKLPDSSSNDNTAIRRSHL